MAERDASLQLDADMTSERAGGQTGVQMEVIVYGDCVSR
jgi:hypothetical protein